jgi:hypothetical protein
MDSETAHVWDLVKLRIPTLRSFLVARPAIWSDDPPDNYAIFGEALRPYIFNLLRSPGNEKELQDAFSFLEEVACADNPVLSDALQVEIVVPLSRSKAERELARKYMGSKLKSLVKDSEKPSLRLWLARLLSH